MLCQLGGAAAAKWSTVRSPADSLGLSAALREVPELLFYCLDLIGSHGSQDGPRTPAADRLGLDVLRL